MWSEQQGLPSVCRFYTLNAQNTGNKDETLFLKMNKVKSSRNKNEPNLPTKLLNETEPNQNQSQQPMSQ